MAVFIILFLTGAVYPAAVFAEWLVTKKRSGITLKEFWKNV